MASTKTQLERFYCDALTTTPVLLNNAREGVDYILLRMKTTAATIAIRDAVAMEDDDLDEVDLTGAEDESWGLIPDTIFNRKQVESNNAGSDWTYDLLFANAAEIDVLWPLNGCICSVEIAASSTITWSTPIETTTAGHFTNAAAGSDYAARPLAIVSSGTGTQIIAAWCGGLSIIHD